MLIDNAILVVRAFQARYGHAMRLRELESSFDEDASASLWSVRVELEESRIAASMSENTFCVQRIR